MDLLKQTNGNVNGSVSSNQVGPIVLCNMNKGNNNHVSLISFNKHNDWIIDWGATDHICYSLSNLILFKQISPIDVTSPDGTKVKPPIWVLQRFFKIYT